MQIGFVAPIMRSIFIKISKLEVMQSGVSQWLLQPTEAVIFKGGLKPNESGTRYWNSNNEMGKMAERPDFTAQAEWSCASMAKNMVFGVSSICHWCLNTQYDCCQDLFVSLYSPHSALSLT